MVAKRITCRLKQIMLERSITQGDLAAVSGVNEKVIRKLCKGTWHGVTAGVLGKLCAALDLQVHDLFEARPADVWYPIRRHGKVTVHLGSTSLEAPGAGAGKKGAFIDRQGIGTWDVRALFHVYASLVGSTLGGLELKYADYIEALHDPKSVEALFTEGNHLILGSPLVNPMAEDALCRAWGIPRRTRKLAGTFPYRFRWDRLNDSSIGEFAGSSPTGIVPQGSKDVIARRTVIAAGDDGEDCGLLFTYRYNPKARAGQQTSEDDDFLVIAIMGHSGCATLAGTRLLCGNKTAEELYPKTRDTPTLRAFRVRYRRPASSPGFDNRELVSEELIPVA